jgi:hypothetical protein
MIGEISKLEDDWSEVVQENELSGLSAKSVWPPSLIREWRPEYALIICMESIKTLKDQSLAMADPTKFLARRCRYEFVLD